MWHDLPIVVCSIKQEPITVFAASIAAYSPKAQLIQNGPCGSSFGESYNAAMEKAFKQYDAIIIANDDIVLTPQTLDEFYADLAILKERHGDKLGMVGIYSDHIRDIQNVQRTKRVLKQVDRLSPIFAYISKKAFETARFPPLNWYSDDVICEDLLGAGFVNYVSRAYVHHAGSMTIGHDYAKLNAEAAPWLHANRPEYVRKWFGGGPMSDDNSRLKICVYAIAKNEAHFVPRFMEGAKEADLVLIADTGSTDGLPEVAGELGAKVHHICISPWRFDKARDTALALIPRDFDVCISLDIDEVLQPGWREEIERVWKKGETTRLRYKFDWGCGIVFYYEKIHARHGYGWKHPCHEYPMPDGRITEVWATTDMLLAVHKPDPTKSRGQYMDLLELSVKEDPECPRNAFYYARELSFHGRWQDSIDACNRYLKLPRADWINERCYAYRVMGRCYNEMGNLYMAEKSFQLAAMEAPNTREPWCELALLLYRQHRWAECFAASIRALQITNKELVYTCDPAVWGHWAHDLASISAWHLGMKEEALKHAKNAVELTPDDERLKANLAMIEDALRPVERLEAAE